MIKIFGGAASHAMGIARKRLHQTFKGKVEDYSHVLARINAVGITIIGGFAGSLAAGGSCVERAYQGKGSPRQAFLLTGAGAVGGAAAGAGLAAFLPEALVTASIAGMGYVICGAANEVERIQKN